MDFYSVMLVLPPLISKMGWNGKLWLKTISLIGKTKYMYFFNFHIFEEKNYVFFLHFFCNFQIFLHFRYFLNFLCFFANSLLFLDIFFRIFPDYFLLLDFWDFEIFCIFLDFLWFLDFFPKVSKANTKSYWGFYWALKMAESKPKEHKKLFFLHGGYKKPQLKAPGWK